MRYTIEKRAGYVKAEMAERDSAEEEYIQVLARRCGLDFRTFQSEQSAVAWLTAAGAAE